MWGVAGVRSSYVHRDPGSPINFVEYVFKGSNVHSPGVYIPSTFIDIFPSSTQRNSLEHPLLQTCNSYAPSLLDSALFFLTLTIAPLDFHPRQPRLQFSQLQLQQRVVRNATFFIANMPLLTVLIASCDCSTGSCHAPVNHACGSSSCNCNSAYVFPLLYHIESPNNFILITSCGCESNNCNCN